MAKIGENFPDVPEGAGPRDRKVLMPALTRAHQLFQSARTIRALQAQSTETYTSYDVLHIFCSTPVHAFQCLEN